MRFEGSDGLPVQSQLLLPGEAFEVTADDTLQASQLLKLDWIGLHLERSQHLTVLGPGGVQQRLRLETRISCNNILAARQFTLAGMGLSLQPVPEVRELLARGELLPLLPDWQLEPIGLHIVTPRRDAQPAKVRYAIEALRRHLVSA